MIKNFHTGIIAACTAIILTAASCTDDIENYAPGGGQLTSVNFYGVSQTFPLYPQINGKYPGIGIFVDTIPFRWATINNDLSARVPYFEFEGSATTGTYPFLSADANALLYMDVPSGNKTIGFNLVIASQGASVVHLPIVSLLDTTVLLPAGGHQIIYFTDTPAAEGAIASYRLVQAEQPRRTAIEDGKVSVRFVHLSADAGNFNVMLLKPDGTETPVELSREMTFGKYSDYVALTPAGNEQFGQLVLNVYVAGREDPLVVGIPSEAGHSFEVLLTGLSQSHERRIITSVKEGAVPEYTKVTLPQSLKTIVRQTY